MQKLPSREKVSVYIHGLSKGILEKNTTNSSTMPHFPKIPKYRFKHPSAKNYWKCSMKNSNELREKLGCKAIALSFPPVLTWNSIPIKQMALKKY